MEYINDVLEINIRKVINGWVVDIDSFMIGQETVKHKMTFICGTSYEVQDVLNNIEWAREPLLW